MEIKELFSESIGTLVVNKMRTGLSALGVIIGIGSVITLVSLGQASQKMIEDQIQSLGSNLLTVSPGAQQSGGVRGASGGGTTLTLEDAQAIKDSREISVVQNVSPELSRRAQVVTAKSNTNTQIMGVTDVYQEIRKIKLTSGSFISSKDVDGISKVAVLGPQTVTDLFGENLSPLGQTIRINNQALKVIGVTESKGGSGFMNQDDMVFVPLTTAQKILFGVDYLSSISIEAKNAEVMSEAQTEVGYLLLSRHKLKNPEQADFSIISQADILGAATQVTGTFTTLLSGIAAISLLVGGIGIMNIMLMSVTERTREIGLKKALGAKKKVIISEFLLEAVIVTFTGGLLGMFIGVAASFMITKIINLPFIITINSILLSFGVSGIIGVLFGWYPARKASNLQPIEALRYE